MFDSNNVMQIAESLQPFAGNSVLLILSAIAILIGVLRGFSVIITVYDATVEKWSSSTLKKHITKLLHNPYAVKKKSRLLLLSIWGYFKVTHVLLAVYAMFFMLLFITAVDIGIMGRIICLAAATICILFSIILSNKADEINAELEELRI